MFLDILFEHVATFYLLSQFPNWYILAKIFFLDSYRYELGRQAANTKLSSNKTIRRIRVRGGNVKWRALRLDTGNYSWGSEAVTRKTRILDVVYNASNNELVRTQTLVKNAIVQVDAAPFKQWYLQHYGVEIGRKKKVASKKDSTEVILCKLCSFMFPPLVVYLYHLFLEIDILFGCWIILGEWYVGIDGKMHCCLCFILWICFLDNKFLKVVTLNAWVLKKINS